MNVDVIKCHGSGNDFLLIDEMDTGSRFTEEERAQLALSLCHRDTALGADGILYVLPSDSAHARMRVFNADGSEASMCGNGLRCVARFVCEKLGKDEAVVETMKADLQVKKQEDIYPEIPTYLVEISPVSFRLADLPLQLEQEKLQNEPIHDLSETLNFTALAVPNPHIVTIVDSDVIHSNVQKNLSEYVNGPNPLFPDGVNVSFVKLLTEGAIYVRTFERGVGFTNACGTAMSASSLVTCLNGFNEMEQTIEVYNNGGKVRCVVHKKGDGFWIALIGNATYVYKTAVEIDENDYNQFSVLNKSTYDAETVQYEKLQKTVQEFLAKYM
ncbi:diaminopimelate epimerase [Bacillus benzoevorans]|uniref:Diaminopimelate epimerase n=1 Tax=Bacillus benzoevorans TaxID=1456 RepID=A0A7X0HVK0_9BACI|nr:diaminopimelate epimerase [Bacillus benzoevorans]